MRLIALLFFLIVASWAKADICRFVCKNQWDPELKRAIYTCTLTCPSDEDEFEPSPDLADPPPPLECKATLKLAPMKMSDNVGAYYLDRSKINKGRWTNKFLFSGSVFSTNNSTWVTAHERIVIRYTLSANQWNDINITSNEFTKVISTFGSDDGFVFSAQLKGEMRCDSSFSWRQFFQKNYEVPMVPSTAQYSHIPGAVTNVSEKIIFAKESCGTGSGTYSISDEEGYTKGSLLTDEEWEHIKKVFHWTQKTTVSKSMTLALPNEWADVFHRTKRKEYTIYSFVYDWLGSEPATQDYSGSAYQFYPALAAPPIPDTCQQ